MAGGGGGHNSAQSQGQVQPLCSGQAGGALTSSVTAARGRSPEARGETLVRPKVTLPPQAGSRQPGQALAHLCSGEASPRGGRRRRSWRPASARASSGLKMLLRLRTRPAGRSLLKPSQHRRAANQQRPPRRAANQQGPPAPPRPPRRQPPQRWGQDAGAAHSGRGNTSCQADTQKTISSASPRSCEASSF